MSYESARNKAQELYDLTRSIEAFPERGSLELSLHNLQKEHRYLLYQSTSRNTIKIIYFLDKKSEVVYVTDFFPTEMDEKKIKDRNS